MDELRRDPRKADTVLPAAFKNIVVHIGPLPFFCHAVDAGAFGLGLVAEKHHQTHIALRQKLVLGFGGFQVEAEVLNLAENYGPHSFRFGVLLTAEDQLGPYRKLLG